MSCGIRVNNVDPSATTTPMFLPDPPEVIKQFEDANPLGWIATPGDRALLIPAVSCVAPRVSDSRAARSNALGVRP